MTTAKEITTGTMSVDGTDNLVIMVDDEPLYIGQTFDGIPSELVNAEANAHELARRWNAHAGLVAALKMAHELLIVMAEHGPRDADAMEARDKARAALAAATAEGGGK